MILFSFLVFSASILCPFKFRFYKAKPFIALWHNLYSLLENKDCTSSFITKTSRIRMKWD